MKKYFYQFKVLLFLWMTFDIADAGLDVFSALIMQELSDNALSANFAGLRWTVVKCITYVSLCVIDYYLLNRWYAKFLSQVKTSLKRDLFHHIMCNDFNSFISSKTSKYVSVLNNDIFQVENAYFWTIPTIITTLISMAVATVALIYFSPILALVDIPMCVIPIVLPMILQKKIGRISTGLFSEIR